MMTTAQSNQPAVRKPLRLWPGIVAAALLVLFKVAVGIIAPGAPPVNLLGGLVGGLLILVWWVFFSRAPWSERLGAIVLMLAALFVTSRYLHESIDGRRLFPMLAIPVVLLALVAWAVASRRLSSRFQRASMVATILLACGAFSLLRTSGTSGDGHFSFHLRWTPTPEQRLLALAPPTKPPAEPPAPDAKPLDSARVTSLDSGRGGSLDSAWGGPAARSADPASPKSDVVGPAMIDRGSTRAEWPGFRGPGRDGVIPGVRIAINWATSPPIELWRRPIGPGWSSFAVHGDRLYTQEQRGDNEIVGCYNARTGEPVWQHRDAARFWEAAGGAGPRATPTLGNGRVYTFGATGILNALDAGTGAVVWSRNAAADAGVENPGWGFASSPLLVNDVVIVAASGRLAAYDVATGHPRWFGPKGGNGYSSPHLVTIDGVAQILLLRGSRTISVAPADGALLWEHVWQLGVGIVQPALIADGEILIVAADSMGGQGLRRIAVSRGDSGWTVEERWTSRGLKPYFNDFVVHKGHAFGFDGSILASIDLTDGQRTWKGGRYGNGQLVLLPDQDALLVLSEEGEIAVVEATPDQFREHARFKALEGKTWNHPVIVGDVLLVRNGEEMAAFRLSLAGR